MRYYIIAGEASGDLHGSNLMKGIYAEDPQAEIRFWGGDLMESVWAESEPVSPAAGGEDGFTDRATPLAAGTGEWLGNSPVDCFNEPARSAGVGGVVSETAFPSGLVRHYKDGAIIGFVEVFVKARMLLGNVSFCKKDILQWKP